MGVSLLPALATVNLPALLTAHPLREPACLRTVGVDWRGGKVLSPIASLFRNDFAAAARAPAKWIGLEAVT